MLDQRMISFALFVWFSFFVRSVCLHVCSFQPAGQASSCLRFFEFVFLSSVYCHTFAICFPQTKPARAGSSIGVSIAFGLQDALEKAQQIILDGIDSRVVVELFAAGGREFTAIVLDVPTHSPESQPVTLLPTEVELVLDDASESAIFSYRRKYLPTRQVSYYTPPRFSHKTVTAIRAEAARLFRVLGLRDFARVDGWLLPNVSPKGDGGSLAVEHNEADGTIVFADVNLMSGMEQTSFLFQQAAEVGLGHANVLRRVLDSACQRTGVRRPDNGVFEGQKKKDVSSKN